MTLTRIIRWREAALALCAAAMLTGCIDEDLSDCDNNFRIDYTVRLRTNLSTTLQTELTTAEEQQVAARLSEELKPIFTDHVSDLDLSFFKLNAASRAALTRADSTASDSAATATATLALHENYIVNASETSHTIYLPADNYRHVALANVSGEPLVALKATDNLAAIGLQQLPADVIDGHSAGLYTARLDMDVENRDQVFHTNLYLANAAVAIVVTPEQMQVDSVRGYLYDMATSFNANDSTYAYDNSPTIRMRHFETAGKTTLYAASFPSRGNVHGKIFIHTPTGVSEAEFTADQPLPPGDLLLLKLSFFDEDGHVKVTATSKVGASVKLDWNKGDDYVVDM